MQRFIIQICFPSNDDNEVKVRKIKVRKILFSFALKSQAPFEKRWSRNCDGVSWLGQLMNLENYVDRLKGTLNYKCIVSSIVFRIGIAVRLDLLPEIFFLILYTP